MEDGYDGDQALECWGGVTGVEEEEAAVVQQLVSVGG